MALPELIRKTAEREFSHYCENKVYPCFRKEVRIAYRMESDHVILYEERVVESNPGHWTCRPVAQFRYQPELRQWTLHYYHAQHSWRLYLNTSPSLNLKQLLQAVDDDPFHSFWE